jgi:S-adenosylmethionine synthetase
MVVITKMVDEIHIQEMTGPTAAEADVEIVERKGLGHPDTICDLVMDRISQALSQSYLQHFGRILHHNCDKGLLVAGRAERRFGGGRIIEPMRLVIGDRATLVREFDVAELAVETARRWFRANLPRIDPGRHLQYQVELKGGSEELTHIFDEPKAILSANDTSAAVGYAPLTETERIVLEAERFLNAAEFKTKFPESGTDIKVMGVRRKERLNLTVAMPLLDQYVTGEEDYFRRKEQMCDVLVSHLRSCLDQLADVTVTLNALDQREAGSSGMYLSVLGTSAEDADSGAVGRGNQVNGLIALRRPRGSEAAAGKNPVSHVGKIYSVLTYLLANEIYTQVSGIREVLVWLCSRIGDPVDRPQVASVEVKLKGGTELAEVQKSIDKILRRGMSRMPLFCQELAQGKYPIC